MTRMDKQNDTEYSQDNWDNAVKAKGLNPNSMMEETGENTTNYFSQRNKHLERYQGKRKDQMDFSQKITFWSMVGIIVIMLILCCTNGCKD